VAWSVVARWSCRLLIVHAASALILLRLWAKTPMSAPDPGAGQAVEQGAVPAGSAFEVGDAAFAAGAPLDQATEGSLVFGVAAGRSGLARIGRASTSCRLTIRRAESGMTPASQEWVWATTGGGVPQRRGQVVDGAAEPSGPSAGGRAQRAAGVAQHRGGVADGVHGQVGQFPGDPMHDRLRLVPGLAQPQPGVDRPGTAAGGWVRSRHRVRRAAPTALIRPIWRFIAPIAPAGGPTSVGRCTLADTTVVSARTFPTRSSFALFALASNASLSCSITSLPHGW
jgi:hypothetical protein